MHKMVGIECGFPLRLVGGRIDELEKTQHYTYFASDIMKAKDLNVSMIRYGIPWHMIELSKGVFNWRWIDGALDLLSMVGIIPIVDLCHFGTPDWLLAEGGFASPNFAKHFADYAEAFARRYPKIVYYTLINEPLIAARFCGRHAFWHPYRSDAFELMCDHFIDAIKQAHARVKNLRPEAIFMQNDNCEHHTVGLPCCEEHTNPPEHLIKKVSHLNEERFYIWDRTVDCWDILGLDYYPWTEELHYCNRQHSHSFRGFYSLGKEYHERYNKPIMIAETDNAGTIEARRDWMDITFRDCGRLALEGIPVFGYCWWPMIDNIDWGAFDNDGLPDNAGLYAMVKDSDGQWRREHTPLVDHFRSF